MRTPQLVSVIMPFRDAGKYIDESIRSVVAQTHPHWELILVDDGSSDESRSIAEAWAAREPDRIRLLPPAHGGSAGASAARNRGLAASTGHVIALLDADDVWLPRKLAEQLPLLAAHPEADVVYGNTLYWYRWGDPGPDEPGDFTPELGVAPGRVIPPPRLLELMLRGLASVPATCSLLMRREAVERTGGFQEEFTSVYTDQVFYAKLFLDSAALPVSTAWDRYRRHAESSCSTAEVEGIMLATRRRYLEWLEEHLRGRGLEGSPVWRAARAELRWIEAPPLALRVRRYGMKLHRRLRRLAGAGA